MGFWDFFSGKKKEALDQGLEKTRENVFTKIAKVLVGKSTVDDEVLDQLEEILITSDVGVETTLKIIGRIEERVKRDSYVGSDQLQQILREEIAQLLSENETTEWEDYTIPAGNRPYVLMVVGVNGVGKTTTIGKLAHIYQQKGYKVVIGAADTFRAAAVDQLEVWAKRAGCGFVNKGMNADPAAVAFDTVKYAVDNGYDLAIIDTAGRLHNKANLMQELGKIKRVMSKVMEGKPDEVMLVLDASTGQNAMNQAKEFTAVTEVDSLAMTKLDGTAKGGVVIGISDQLKVPVKYIGVGEGIDDLQIFNKKAFVESLFGK